MTTNQANESGTRLHPDAAMPHTPNPYHREQEADMATVQPTHVSTPDSEMEFPAYNVLRSTLDRLTEVIRAQGTLPADDLAGVITACNEFRARLAVRHDRGYQVDVNWDVLSIVDDFGEIASTTIDLASLASVDAALTRLGFVRTAPIDERGVRWPAASTTARKAVTP